MQTSGRVGRDPAQSAAYITVFEKKVSVRGLSPLLPSFKGILFITTYSAEPTEREEAKVVRGIFSSGQCLRTALYRSFSIENPAGICASKLKVSVCC